MILRALALVAIVFAFLGAPALAANTTGDDVFSVCDQNPSATICRERNPKENPVIKIIRAAATIVALLTGVAAVIFIILGGLTMITSAGNPEAVANARKRIIYAVIGLVIAALSWTVIAFVTDKFIK